MLTKIVRDEFDVQIRLLFIEFPDVSKFLLNHERKEICINNLMRHLRDAEQKGLLRDIRTIKWLVLWAVKTFSRAAIDQYEDYCKSENEKARIRFESETKAAYEKEIESESPLDNVLEIKRNA